MYWAMTMALAVSVSPTATTMSPLGVKSIRFICQSAAKLLTCCMRCSASSFHVSLVSPHVVKYAEAYIVMRLSGVMLSSAIASSSVSLLECFARWITASLCSEISRPSHGVVRLGPSLYGMCEPPLRRPLTRKLLSSWFSCSLSGECGRRGFQVLHMYQSWCVSPTWTIRSITIWGVMSRSIDIPYSVVCSRCISIVLDCRCIASLVFSSTLLFSQWLFPSPPFLASGV